jgi:hypothetical protein
MKGFGCSAAVIAALLLSAWNQVALADTSEAMCQVTKHGETRKGQSGPCDFSQRHGYVSIDLRNGDRIELTPGKKANHFTDQNGTTVTRTASGNEHVYDWPHRKIVVTFESPGYGSNGEKSHSRDGTNIAESACMVAVNNQYGGRVKSLHVVSSDFSKASSTVVLNADGEHWRCVSSNHGDVQSLNRQNGHRN